MTPDLVPAVDAAGLPGPVWLFQALLVFTFFLHLLFMNLTLGGTLLAAGFAILFVACVRIIRFMSEEGYDPSQLDLPSTKLALLGTTLFVTGAQIVFSSFFLGLFNIEPMSEAT